ncbi:MAG: maleylacetoacetate isomerase [Pseudomonadota bacterium]
MKLFGYWRSSATYRVRIALALKGLVYDYAPVNLLEGEQRKVGYADKNPQALVPSLETDDGEILTQSLAIVEYLEEAFPEPSLLPSTPALRAKARAIAAAIACEAQPFMNLRIQNYLKNEGGFAPDALSDWLNRWPGGAMRAAEAMAAETRGVFAVGDAPGIADAFIVPQVFAAQRFGVDLTGCPHLVAIAAACNDLDAFKAAHPKNQPDAT